FRRCAAAVEAFLLSPNARFSSETVTSSPTRIGGPARAIFALCVPHRVSMGSRLRSSYAKEYKGVHPNRTSHRFRYHRDPRRDSLSRAGSGQIGREERSEEHTSELQSLAYLVCRLLLEKKKNKKIINT